MRAGARAVLAGLGAALALSGCWDFDGRFAAVSAELADAGACHQPLCLDHSYAGSEVFFPDTSSYIQFRMVAGVVGTSLDDVVVQVVAGDEYTSAYTHTLLRFLDGGVSRVDITQQLLPYAHGMATVGTPDDFWAVSTYTARRFQRFVPANKADPCEDGNRYWGAWLRSPSEVYFTGTDQVCRWPGADGGTQEVFATGTHYGSVYLNTALVTPEGVVAGGCESDGGYCFSQVFYLDGGTAPIPDDYDPEDWGLMTLSGAGSEVWAASRTGRIFKRAASGAYQLDHAADYRLFDLQALAPDDVWAVGNNGLSALHFDGATWSEVALPPAASVPTRWERVLGVDGGLVFAGAEDNPDAGGLTPVVRFYRRGR